MTRYLYGGSGQITTLVTVSGVQVYGPLAGGVQGTCWDAQTGGSRLTDLQDSNGNAVTALTSLTGGKVPIWRGPDAVTQMWVDWGTGVRDLFEATDFDEALQQQIAAIGTPSGGTTDTTARTAAAAAQSTADAATASVGAVSDRVTTLERATAATATVRFVRKSTPTSGDGTWPARPTSDGAVMVLWDGPPNADGSGPPTVTTGTGGMRPGDKWLSHP